MRFLELRRHSLRLRPDEHLSQEGITLARWVGNDLGAFDLVVTSPLPRAFETAIAMGFAVDEKYLLVSFDESEWAKLDELLAEGTPFEKRALAMKASGIAARYASELVSQWVSIARRLPESGRALVISHGGYLDDSAVACLPNENHREWGENFGHCEGIRLAFDGSQFVTGKILRVQTTPDVTRDARAQVQK